MVFFLRLPKVDLKCLYLNQSKKFKLKLNCSYI